MSVRAFVIGHPIAHSRSPLIHRTWLDLYGIDGSYDPIDVPPEDLGAFFGRLRAGEFAGGNVTVPHKEGAFALCDAFEPALAFMGAANTLVVSGGRVLGTNTDHLGFLGNLDQQVPGWYDGLGSAIVLGAGGAARAVIVALAQRGAARIEVLNRTPDKARALSAELNPHLRHVVRPGGLDDFAGLAPTARLVVNTTTIGMGGTRFPALPLDRLPKSAVVTDIVYTPLVTPLLADARALGLQTVDGLGMLLHQAVPGFEAWFGVRPEVTDALYDKVAASIKG